MQVVVHVEQSRCDEDDARQGFGGRRQQRQQQRQRQQQAAGYGRGDMLEGATGI
jgi:hypothetical protein